MKYTGKSGIIYEVEFCSACHCDSISCKSCDNSSCNGGSCDVCNDDFTDFTQQIVGKYLGD